MTDASPDFLTDGPAGAAHTLVLAHGAGAPMEHPWMTRIARGVAAHGIRVVRFEFPYMAARRSGGGRRAPDREPVLRRAWLDVIAALGGGDHLVIGGKSMGGRIASMVADEVGARGLVCLGYPFHPPGRPAQLRTAHLEALRTPTLIVQGERDPFAPPPRSPATASRPRSTSNGSPTATTPSSHAPPPATRPTSISRATELVAAFVAQR